MKVEHILVSLLFVFLLYHFTCKCRVEGFDDEPTCSDIGYQQRGDITGVSPWDYCIHKDDDVIDGGACSLVYHEYGDRYDEIFCEPRVGYGQYDEDIKWGRCGNDPIVSGRYYTWMVNDEGKLKCKMCTDEWGKPIQCDPLNLWPKPDPGWDYPPIDQ